MALADVGFHVKVLCPPNHPASTIKAVERIFTYSGVSPLSSLASAISSGRPDLIIPGDDLITQQLHALHRRERAKSSMDGGTCALIERSLGAADSFSIVYSRSQFMALAEKEGVRVPKTQTIGDVGALQAWADRMGYPAVLKANGTSGGEGVRIVHTEQQAQSAFRRLQAPPIVARVAKRVLLDHDTTLVLPMLLRRRSGVSVQTFIPGREATSLVACWKGTVLAALHFEVLSKQDTTGPASVVRAIDHPEMVSAAEKMVRRLNLSGLHGFDFMLEARTGNAYLIEINPRTTQVGHLRLGAGKDLPAALHAAVSGIEVSETVKVTDNDTIAFFPQELLRNPASSFLQSGFHDVPWQEVDLLSRSLRKHRKWSTLFSPGKWSQAFSEVKIPRS
jgi:formate-dependent phosphoribosylglycinamide formyltransferase (GAR transformylase)